MTGRFHDDMTLAEARDALRPLVKEGHQCPCCKQHVQMYRWSLYATAVQLLILFYREGGVDDYVSSKLMRERGHKGQGDASRLRHWGLVEEESTRREDGGRSGYWRVTERGARFIRRQVTIPKYVWVYDGRALYHEGEQVSVVDALGKKFDYGEMMGAGT